MPLPLCPVCGSRTLDNETCPRCSYDAGGGSTERRRPTVLQRTSAFLRRPAIPPHRQNIPWRSPLLAAGMSVAVIGSGHIFVKRYREGAAYLGTAIVLTWAVTNVNLWALFLLAVLWSYQVTLAYDAAVEFDWNSIFEADCRV